MLFRYANFVIKSQAYNSVVDMKETNKQANKQTNTETPINS